MREALLILLLGAAGLTGCGQSGLLTDQRNEQISAPGMQAYELSLASHQHNPAQLAVAWHGGTHLPDAIYLQWLDTHGRPAGTHQQITDQQRHAYEADLQFIDDDAVLVWYEKDLSSGALSAWIARVKRNGVMSWRHALSARSGNARNPVVRVANHTIHVAWIEEALDHPTSLVWSTRFDADGTQRDSAIHVGDASAKTWNLNACLDDKGRFYVVYDATLGTRAKELHLLMINYLGDGQRIRHHVLSSDDGYDSSYPDLAINETGQVALTWFDERDGNREVYLASGSLTQLQSAAPLVSQRITHTPAASIGAYLAWNGNRLALVWCDAEPGQQELYAQLFDEHGQFLTQVLPLTHTHFDSSIPAIRAWRQGFVIAWNEIERSGGAGHESSRQSRAMLRFLR